MSQQLSFTITASDQASKVVDQVKKKVQDMGKDIGKSVAAFVGPTALIGGAISMISQRMEEMRQKAKEAFDWGSGLSESAAAMGVTVEEFQKFQEISSRSGQSIGNVGKAFKSAADLIAEAKAGNLAAAEALEALGFKLKDLETIKPEDVVARLGDALASIENPTDKAAAAFAAFGAEGKALIQTLERIRGLAKGPAPEGLTQEEADFLAEEKRLEEAKSNRERLKAAREAAALRFLQGGSDEAKKILDEEGVIAGRIAAAASGTIFGAGKLEVSPEKAAQSERVQKRIQEELAAKARIRAAIAEADAVAGEVAASGLTELGKKRQEKEAKEAKEKEEKEKQGAKDAAKPDKIKTEAFKPETLTVSSLREIGGGMAGEMSIAEENARQSLDYQRRTAEALEKIINGNQPITDFTKPIPSNLPAGVLPGGPRMIG